MDKLNSLSIIICAYNEEKTINKKIKDILAKDKAEKTLEAIIIDDNSSDKTFEIAQGCLKESKRLKVIRNAYKKGKWGAILTGFKHARGKIICLTDVDVIFQGGTLEKALELFIDPLVGAVVSNQKVSIGGGVPSVNFYERFRNFFRIIESRIDSTTAFHGQCMFFRKDCVELTEVGLMADDLDIAIRIRRNGYKTLFCKDSYYIEKEPNLFDEDSKRIFRRRARAVAQVLIGNKDLLFNSRYKKFGFICFPIEFFINIVLPFFIMAVVGSVAVGVLLFPVKYKILFVISLLFFLINYQLLKMAWYQMISVVSYLLNPRNTCIRWTTPR